MEPTFAGVYFIFACLGLRAFATIVRQPPVPEPPARRYTKPASTHRLEVDINGRGYWVEHSCGPESEMRAQARHIKHTEGMPTRITPCR